MNQVVWNAPDGRQFVFHVCSSAGNWSESSGVYVFAKFQSQQGAWDALYVGQCVSFRSRIPGHEKWSPAVQMGAESVLACPIAIAGDRDLVEGAMICQFDPPLNRQHPRY